MCYKRDIAHKIPEEDWFCMRCLAMLENDYEKHDAIQCLFCSHLIGVLIQLRNQTETSTSAWVHMTCVNWIKEIHFEAVTD